MQVCFKFARHGRVRDFHPLERAHGAQTKKAQTNLICASCIIIFFREKEYASPLPILRVYLGKGTLLKTQRIIFIS